MLGFDKKPISNIKETLALEYYETMQAFENNLLNETRTQVNCSFGCKNRGFILEYVLKSSKYSNFLYLLPFYKYI
ncbi:MAG: hypothetical protein SPLUMA2_SPLUMAMAG2_01068 [uncultured Sulfurimonas sp.]|nr:MAG: hypothetical protein SPLUMA1_SPLUMAMAG1_01819 [uncultured Sulfurimonas sp.]CAI6162762.1 MAG: hypothetical protein SPLUMA2_SPLUMAMAG2_01068 [uncultured Sulfurimonas sp.]